jgi:hypothetical protein
MGSGSGTNTGAGNPSEFTSTGHQQGFKVDVLFSLVNDATISAQTKLAEIKTRQSSISIGDMFEMQMLMNHLSQLSEMASSVVQASNTALMSMARGVKGG